MSTLNTDGLARAKKGLKTVIGIMVAFLVLGPFVAPLVWPEEFAKFNVPAYCVFYTLHVLCFGGLILHFRHQLRKLDTQEEQR